MGEIFSSAGSCASRTDRSESASERLERTDALNSPHVVAFRRAVQPALPPGAELVIATRLERFVCLNSVREQIQGRHRWSLDVAGEGAAQLSINRRVVIWDGYLAPYGMSVSVRPRPGEAGNILIANAHLLTAIGEIEQEISMSLQNDGVIDATERARIGRSVVEARVRLSILERHIYGCEQPHPQLGLFSPDREVL